MDLYVEWRLKNGTEQQTGALQKGFYEVVPKHLLSGKLLFCIKRRNFIRDVLKYVCIHSYLALKSKRVLTIKLF